MVAILEKTEHNTDFHQIMDFLEASHIRYALTIRPTVYVSHIRQFWPTARVETTDGETKIIAQVNGRTVELFASMLVLQGEGSEHPSEPHHTPSDQDEPIHHKPITQSPQHAQITSHKPIPQSHEQTTSQEPPIQSQSHSIITTPRRITRGSIRISQSKVPSPGADETAFPTGEVRYGEAFPTDTSLDAGQDRENIAKTSAMPHEALPRVTSLGVGMGIATARTSISPAVATASGSFSTAVIFTTASVVTPTTRVTRSSRGVVIGSSSPISVNIASISKKDKGKGKMTEPKQPSKEKVLEQLKLDRSNEMVVKYLSEYEQAKVGLSHDEKVELINELLMYQRHLAQIKKYQAQQNKSAKKTEKRNFYMSILRSNAGWKAKDFKGITFEQIEEKFIPVWEKILSIPTADVYIAKKFATVEDFVLLHDDKIYSESKTRACYI
uniref:Xylulose kinase-1 n=1 Tax=Tanacetum cinerariifolium TaxID=118510 RepID=A0A6L2K042_TANCI|nr:hypothetical protein [Tanacetum cinerariifolium]